MAREDYTKQEFDELEKDYKREVAIVKARPLAVKAGLGLWLLVDGVLIALFIGFLVFYFSSGAITDNRQVASTANNFASLRTVSLSRAAQPVSVDDARVFTSGEGRYDFLVEMENQNAQWYGTFNYFFQSGDGQTDRKRGFVLPLESRPVAAFGVETQGRPTNAQIVVENFEWQRVDAREISDIRVWLSDRNAFVVEDPVYRTDIQLEERNIARSSFTLVNESPFSYWEAPFFVFLERGGSVQAVTLITLNGLEAGESRQVNVNWFGNVPQNASVRVVPNINFFDESVYMPEQGRAAQEDIRDAF